MVARRASDLGGTEARSRDWKPEGLEEKAYLQGWAESGSLAERAVWAPLEALEAGEAGVGADWAQEAEAGSGTAPEPEVGLEQERVLGQAAAEPGPEGEPEQGGVEGGVRLEEADSGAEADPGAPGDSGAWGRDGDREMSPRMNRSSEF